MPQKTNTQDLNIGFLAILMAMAVPPANANIGNRTIDEDRIEEAQIKALCKALSQPTKRLSGGKTPPGPKNIKRKIQQAFSLSRNGDHAELKEIIEKYQNITGDKSLFDLNERIREILGRNQTASMGNSSATNSSGYPWNSLKNLNPFNPCQNIGGKFYSYRSCGGPVTDPIVKDGNSRCPSLSVLGGFGDRKQECTPSTYNAWHLHSDASEAPGVKTGCCQLGAVELSCVQHQGPNDGLYCGMAVFGEYVAGLASVALGGRFVWEKCRGRSKSVTQDNVYAEL